jgi:predicted dinucleotide-binding enzyme
VTTYGVLGTGTVGQALAGKLRELGNDDAAKREVTALLRSFGWRDIVDLGEISGARGMEAMLVLWLRGMQTLGGPMFNVKLVR